MSWPLVTLGSLEGGKGNFVDGPFGSNLKSSEYTESGVPLIQLKNIKPNKYITKDLKFVSQEKADSISRHSYKSGDVCIAKLGAVGTACIIPDDAPDGIIVADVVRFRGDKSLIDYKYFCHFLNSPEGQRRVLALSRGSTRTRTNLTDLKKVEIPLPPLDEQKRIAAILDKADAIRRKRQQAINLADDFLRSVFLDMFGDPVSNPKGWEVKSWKDALSIVNGKNQKAVLSKNGAYPIMGSGGEMGRASDYLTPENSVIIGRKGNINKPILVKENFWNVDTAFGLVPKPSILSFNYLYWFCKLFDFERLNKAVTIPSLTKVDLLQISIPLPGISKQMRFDEVVNKIESIISKNINSSQSANDIFNSLSQKAFSGEL
ncbi:restriction endonuclease subunit S [Pseudoalteromonas sp. 3-MNA-CIBAN-0064]|uniref:restriction endonuclease subunit S n=1 Tax=unclassified Pseudoalteromonas TaxID=194690 RepID=UPI00332DAF25